MARGRETEKAQGCPCMLAPGLPSLAIGKLAVTALGLTPYLLLLPALYQLPKLRPGRGLPEEKPPEGGVFLRCLGIEAYLPGKWGILECFFHQASDRPSEPLGGNCFPPEVCVETAVPLAEADSGSGECKFCLPCGIKLL